MTRGRTTRLLRLLEIALLSAGALCLAWVAVVWVRAELTQIDARAQLRDMVRARTVERPAPAAAAPIPALPSPLVGWLEIPRLGLSVGVLEGDDETTLRVAAGHLPDTPMPWEPGNSAIAGHRDTFFRALRNLKSADDIVLDTPRGSFTYRVTRVRIVGPRDLSVLSDRDEVALTLITCYPFTWLGSAPQRFVVQAVRTPRISSRAR